MNKIYHVSKLGGSILLRCQPLLNDLCIKCNPKVIEKYLVDWQAVVQFIKKKSKGIK
jgi:hypothetical protein